MNAMRLALCALFLQALVLAAGEKEEAVPAPPKDAAGPNTWVRVLAAKTGARDQPVFVYAPGIKRFVAASGMQHTGGAKPRHYDAEEFDLAQVKWFNAYPKDLAQGRPESGPLDDAYANERAKHGHSGGQLFYKDGEHLRLGAGGQWHDGKAYGEYCYAPGGEAGYVYAYYWKQNTLRYDIAAREWTDLKAKPRETCRLWGSMCYDPVNKELFHAGGDGGSAEIATWVYAIEKNEWRKLAFGSEAFNALHAKAVALRWDAKTLLGRCASRHAVAEAGEEAKVDLADEAAKLAGAVAKFAAEVRGVKLEGAEAAAAAVATQRLAAAGEAAKAAGPKLGAAITPELIGEVRAVRAVLEQAVDALCAEPPGRARSQIAFDEANKKVVLFGGDGLDRTLNDTWIYDPATRKWEQRFPERAPAPRAGHILRYLPKAKAIVLAGGYSRGGLPQELWAYDVAANAWKLLKHVPLVKESNRSVSPGCPNVHARTVQVGDVNEDDVLVCVQGNDVWACKVDPSKADEAGTAERSKPSGSYDWNRIDPAEWEKVAPAAAAAKTKAFLDGLKPNTWTAYEFPRYAPGARNRWGTSAYDVDRHQWLFWGGGHATSHEDDVAHFSVRGGFWTIGYHPDDPIEDVYASQPTPLSFHNRVHVPIHAYRAYCYDSTAKQMFYFDRGYDPLAREWRAESHGGLKHKGPMHSHMEPTPKGSVVFSDQGLFRYAAADGTWKALPWTGEKNPGTWCDGAGVCYDSKRDCLWISNDKTILRYDLATGQVTDAKPAKPGAIGKWCLGGEEVYVPKGDLILMMQVLKRPDGRMGQAAWKPEENKYYWADLPFTIGDKPFEPKASTFSWHDAMCYDPVLDLMLINNSSDQRVWVLKFDPASAKLEPVAE